MKKILLSIAFLPLFLFMASPTFASSFSDTFTDSDGTTLHDHNNLWDCNFNSEAVIQSNRATSSGPNSQTCLANSFQNGSISTLVNFPGSSSQYSSFVALRYQDSNNYYFCNLNANDGFVIFKLYQGNLTVLDNVSGSVGSGDHTLQCSISGSTITLTVDGIQRSQVTDTDLPNAGRGGIQITPNSIVDDYNSIDDDAGPTPTPTVTPTPTPTPPSSFSDTFTDSDGTTLQNHNSLWDCNFSSEAVIQSNKAITIGTNAQNCLANTFQNGSVSTEVNFPGSDLNNSSAVLLRYTNSSNYYLCNLNAAHGYVIFKMYQGNFSVLENISGVPGAGNHIIHCSISGSTITLTVDGIQRVQVNDSDLPNPGRGGMQLVPNITVDNYNAINDDEENNEIPFVGTLTVSPNPVTVNTTVLASASFTDVNTLDTHTATIDWGDGNGSQPCAVTESNGSGSVSCTKASGYTIANVYPVQITVSDGTASGQSPIQYVSVYAPTQSSIFTAGHRFSSPAGAYAQNTNLTGNVTFGLSYKYQGSMPVGVRQFSMDFKAANFSFNAATISSLVISNDRATLQGTGTINGSGSYNFLVVGEDSGGIRIKITDTNNNVIYDTQPGASNTATPTTSVNGQVIVH